MSDEIAGLGHEVNVVAINAADAAEHQEALLQVCAYPLLQDEVGVNAFGALGGGKDDFYVYRADGTLAVYLQNGGVVNTDLSTGDGYSNVRDIILAVDN